MGGGESGSVGGGGSGGVGGGPRWGNELVDLNTLTFVAVTTASSFSEASSLTVTKVSSCDFIALR